MIRHHFFLLLACTMIALPIHQASACTLFKITQDGHTLVGNNEDAWSINAHIRFENGKTEEYGAVYFAHYNGSPMRKMIDQGGMNTEGLMFDGLRVEQKDVAPGKGLKRLHFSELMPTVMRQCANIHEAAALIGQYDQSLLNQAIIVLVDRNGEYLVVESDTLLFGNDATYAVSNFRMSACADLDAVPIERYQRGRALLASDQGASLAYGQEVLEAMSVCRSKLGNGTLYSNLLDLVNGNIHLYFYHDFSEQVTFNLKEELAKGDHSVEMASLFGKNAEFEQLVAYATPFHARGLFHFLLVLLAIAGLTGSYGGMALLGKLIARLRGRMTAGASPLIILTLSSAAMIGLIPFLLLQEGVYYFGIGDATDPIHPYIKFLPLVLALFVFPVVIVLIESWQTPGRKPERWVFMTHSTTQIILVALLLYWDLVWIA